MVVVEFIGCPGVGKSSICKSVMNSKSKEGYSLANMHRSELRDGAIARKFISARALFSNDCSELRKAADHYMKRIPDSQSRVWGRDLLIAAYKLNLQKTKSLDYVFFEEGPTQYVTSIAHRKELTQTIQPVIDAMNHTIYVHDTIGIYVIADLHDIIARILNRNKTNDRYKSDDAETMYRQLLVKQRNIEFLIDRLHYKALYTVENTVLPDAVDQVLNILK